MDTLKQLFSDKEIELILEECPYIKKHSPEDIKRILNILSNQKCSNCVIRNIIGRNPEILLRSSVDLEDLIYKFKEYDIIKLDKIFDKYPEILNKCAYHIDTYFFIKKKEGISIEEASKMLEDDPSIIDMTIE